MIEQILKDITPREFLEQYYLRIPYSQPLGAEDLVPLATWETTDRILSRPRLGVEIIKEGEQRGQNDATLTGTARDLLSAGCTLRIHHAERHDSKLGRLAKGFRRDFHSPCSVHLCLTPDSHFGSDWERGAKEVFVFQTQGKMEFSFRRNSTQPGSIWGKQGCGGGALPMVTCSLSPGDWLYLPSGYWHRGKAEEDSITLTVAIAAPAAMKIYDFLKHHLLKSLAWRQRLPALGQGEARAPGEALMRSDGC